MSFRVDFMIIGAMKSGTTDLASKLAHHSRVCFCEKKEPHFFNASKDWASRLVEYHRLYAPLPGQICGEGSTSYSDLGTYPNVVDRLYEYNPNLKFIYLVRDPIDRIKSQYAHRLMRGTAHMDPEQEFEQRRMRYVSQSSYGQTLKRYGEAFGYDRILTVGFETYVREMSRESQRVCEFLELPSEDLMQFTARNTSIGSNRSRLSPVYYLDHVLSYSPLSVRRMIGRRVSVKLREKPELPGHLEQDLWRELKPDMELLSDLSGLDVTPWFERWDRAGEVKGSAV